MAFEPSRDGGLPRGLERGTTLLECVIALLMLCIGGVAAARFQASMLARTAQIGTTQAATQLARQQIERLLTLPTSELVDGHDAPTVAGSPPFARDWQVAPLPSGLQQLTVEVTWPVAHGQRHGVTLTTLRFDSSSADLAAVLLPPGGASAKNGTTIPP